MGETYRLNYAGSLMDKASKKAAQGTSDSPGNEAPPAAKPTAAGQRLVSLDAYRGFIMLMLAANGFGIAALARLPEDAPVWNHLDYGIWQSIAFHFSHPEWASRFGLMGVSFWDLIQPAFMFMVGVAMPFSYRRRAKDGQPAWRRVLHALWRSIVLVLLGVFLYSLRAERTNWMFTNVLAQIGLGYFFAYLLLGRRPLVQIIALVLLLGGYWWYFKSYEMSTEYARAVADLEVDPETQFDGSFAPWSKHRNAAQEFDWHVLGELRTPEATPAPPPGISALLFEPGRVLSHWLLSNPEPFEINRGGYATLNFVPSIGTMLLGILCGQFLMTGLPPWRKVGYLVGGGAICMLLGLAAGEYAVPIVKRIWTPSWTLFSGAYVIWLLALFYMLFDILPLRRLAFPLVVLGMNSIAVYMMGQLLRGWTADKVVGIHLTGFLETLFGPAAMADDMFGRLIGPTAVVIVFWLIAYWMYRQRYFIRV
ncbi:hypothetical protein Mal4_35140 [Maioricimonas rarisocia]|uniref:Uncharacterized protein n=1 Tax=Maioricimonas rarisocia TaxID=2528026 RepID=A0A517Z9L5_9PLAN|nr:DUF5009 domain-containing protein [Maioricimonas rarisocia]QDU39178.1 hypothetical protein Mal4_35140 [Maioricimonas rarisocia]